MWDKIKNWLKRHLPTQESNPGLANCRSAMLPLHYRDAYFIGIVGDNKILKLLWIFMKVNVECSASDCAIGCIGGVLGSQKFRPVQGPCSLQFVCPNVFIRPRTKDTAYAVGWAEYRHIWMVTRLCPTWAITIFLKNRSSLLCIFAIMVV